MRVKARLDWILRPQLFVGFLVICLCVGAANTMYRASYGNGRSSLASHPAVNGTSTSLPVPDCAATPCIALSFDDGPNAEVTPRVLDILAAENVKATFFIVGKRVSGNEPLLRRIYAEGHEIGNHSWDHADFTKLVPDQMDDELLSTQQAIVNAGVPVPHLFRPPYGAVNDAVRSHVNNMAIVRWDIDPADWEVLDAAKINESIVAQARPGGIILMHDIYRTTADALAPAIAQLKAHYQFVTVSQLMQLSPGDQGQFFGR